MYRVLYAIITLSPLPATVCVCICACQFGGGGGGALHPCCALPFHLILDGSLKLSVQPEVQDALSSGQPVVALETAIITHGMPYPRNLE